MAENIDIEIGECGKPNQEPCPSATVVLLQKVTLVNLKFFFSFENDKKKTRLNRLTSNL